ncbi:MAG: hypothetical protein AAF558_01465 [Verrucomicrobiota bacterium]
MNWKRFIVTVVATWIFFNVFEFIFHGKVLAGIYEQNSSLWRTEAETQELWFYHPFGLLFITIAMTALWSRFKIHSGSLLWGVVYGFLIGCMYVGSYITMIPFALYPMGLVGYWMIGILLEMTIAGTVISAIYKHPDDE